MIKFELLACPETTGHAKKRWTQKGGFGRIDGEERITGKCW